MSANTFFATNRLSRQRVSQQFSSLVAQPGCQSEIARLEVQLDRLTYHVRLTLNHTTAHPIKNVLDAASIGHFLETQRGQTVFNYSTPDCLLVIAVLNRIHQHHSLAALESPLKSINMNFGHVFGAMADSPPAKLRRV